MYCDYYVPFSFCCGLQNKLVKVKTDQTLALLEPWQAEFYHFVEPIIDSRVELLWRIRS